VSLSLLVGRAMLGTLLRSSDVELLEPSLDASKSMPRALDYFGLKFALSRR
jgi:hypothetical protein